MAVNPLEENKEVSIDLFSASELSLLGSQSSRFLFFRIFIMVVNIFNHTLLKDFGND